jgi:energy-coupling factor transporter ATP-binding protein EcfA2
VEKSFFHGSYWRGIVSGRTRKVERIKATESLLVHGSTGSGKTHLLKHLSLRAPRPHRFLYYDLGEEYGDVCDISSPSLSDFLSRPLEYFGVGSRIQILADPPNAEKELDALAYFTFECLRQTSLVFDENEDYFPRGLALSAVQRISLRGRHSGVSLWLTVKRPALIDRTLCSQARMFSATPSEPSDLEYFRQRFRFREWEQLQKYDFVVFSRITQRAEALIRAPKNF